MTPLADVVAASSEVAGTGSRTGKVAILADLLRKLEPDEVPIAVGFLTGVPRQGRVGVGYRTVYGVERPAAEQASLTVAELDTAISAVKEATGSGSAARRKEILGELLGRATADEAGFVRRLFTGELRQGALAGVMTDAVAKAAGVSGQVARRALMLSGDLTRTAEIAMTTGEEGLREVGFELFRPIFPMLASTAESVGDAVAGYERALVEWKLDGIRIQIHRRDDEVRVYTRNLNDITPSLPGIVEAVRRLPFRQAVLDGEALWMGEHGPAAFQETVSRIDRDAPPEGVVTFLFDLLHVDGEDLLDTPLEQRACPARGAGTGPEDPGAPHVLRGRGEPRARRGAERRARGRRRQGRGVPVCGRPPWEVVEEGEAGPDLRPGSARRRVGTRQARGLALESAPRGPRPGDRRLRDGREVLQGADG